MSFIGGVHLKEAKITKYYRIDRLPTPQLLYLPIVQHSGKPSVPIVKTGDYVLKYQKIAEASGFISSTLHSPVSGKVVEIKEIYHPTLLKKIPAIVIESDGHNKTVELNTKFKEYYRYSPEDLIAHIKESGIVGLGGAMFPSHVKLSPPKDKVIDYVIANGCECEPFLTCDDRVMQECSYEIVDGLKIVMYILNALKGIIVIEDNKAEAYSKLYDVVAKTPNIEIKVVKTKYPQGAEKQLIKTVLNKEIPSGGLPMDVGVVVHNVSTLLAIHNAIVKGIPLVERVITISGDIERKGNFLVPIGIIVKDIVKLLNINLENVNKIIFGGPMMGIAQKTLEVPIIKGTSGLLFFNSSLDCDFKQCIRCGKCVNVCPMKLMPNFLSLYIENKKWEKVKEFSIFDCIECGCCSYICVAKRPIVAQIKYAKALLTEISKNNKI